MKLKKSLNGTLIGKLYQYFQISLSIISCIEYIAQTYVRNHNPDQLQYMKYVEISFVGIFAVDWAINLFTADHTINFLVR